MRPAFFIFNLLLKDCLTVVKSYIDIRLAHLHPAQKKSIFKKPTLIRVKAMRNFIEELVLESPVNLYQSKVEM